MYSYNRQASQDVVLHGLSFIRTDRALPELLEYARPFKLHPYADFTVIGPTLARVLGQKEEDVGEFLRGKMKDDLLPFFRNNRELLEILSPLILEMTQELLLSHTPNRPKQAVVTYADSTQSSVKVNIRKRSVQLGMRFDITGK